MPGGGGVSKQWFEKRKKRFFGGVSNQKAKKKWEKTKKVKIKINQLIGKSNNTNVVK